MLLSSAMHCFRRWPGVQSHSVIQLFEEAFLIQRSIVELTVRPQPLIVLLDLLHGLLLPFRIRAHDFGILLVVFVVEIHRILNHAIHRVEFILHADPDIDHRVLLRGLLDCQANEVLQFLKALYVEIVNFLSVQFIDKLDDANWLVSVEADLGVLVLDRQLVNECWTDEDVPHLLDESQIVDVRTEQLLSNDVVGVVRFALLVNVAAQTLIIRIRDLLGFSEIVRNLIKVLLFPAIVLIVLQGRQSDTRLLHDLLSLFIVSLFILLPHQLVCLVLGELVHRVYEVSLDVSE